MKQFCELLSRLVCGIIAEADHGQANACESLLFRGDLAAWTGMKVH